MSSKQSSAQAPEHNLLVELSRAYVRASSDYWTGCAELWKNYGKEPADSKSPRGFVEKTARLYSEWAAVTQRSLETYLAAWPK